MATCRPVHPFSVLDLNRFRWPAVPGCSTAAAGPAPRSVHQAPGLRAARAWPVDGGAPPGCGAVCGCGRRSCCRRRMCGGSSTIRPAAAAIAITSHSVLFFFARSAAASSPESVPAPHSPREAALDNLAVAAEAPHTLAQAEGAPHTPVVEAPLAAPQEPAPQPPAQLPEPPTPPSHRFRTSGRTARFLQHVRHTCCKMLPYSLSLECRSLCLLPIPCYSPSFACSLLP